MTSLSETAAGFAGDPGQQTYRAFWLAKAQKYQRASERAAAGIFCSLFAVVFSYAPLDFFGPAWLKEHHGLLAAMAIATPVAFLVYFLLKRDVAAGLLLDMSKVARAMTSGPQLPLPTLLWLVARRRLIRNLLQPAYWLAAELGISLLLGAMIRAEIVPDIPKSLADTLIALVSLTLGVMLVRLVTFLTASRWLATRRGGSRLSES